ncbi:MAG: endonuclease III domain-containing protein [Thermoplasmata archaeon]
MRKPNVSGPRIDEIMVLLSNRYQVGAFPGKGKGTTIRREMRDPYRVLISTILSHRTMDENTNQAATNLFRVFPTPESLAGANIREIEELIRPAGFYKVKARNIKRVASLLVKEHQGKVPEDLDSLLKLPSVGRKTANCVLVYAFGKLAIPVDTHVHRISNRLGLVQTRNPRQTEEALSRVVPKKYWLRLNELFVKFGQEICRPIAPLCYDCHLAELCESYPIATAGRKNEDRKD